MSKNLRKMLSYEHLTGKTSTHFLSLCFFEILCASLCAKYSGCARYLTFRKSVVGYFKLIVFEPSTLSLQLYYELNIAPIVGTCSLATEFRINRNGPCNLIPYY